MIDDYAFIIVLGIHSTMNSHEQEFTSILITSIQISNMNSWYYECIVWNHLYEFMVWSILPICIHNMKSYKLFHTNHVNYFIVGFSNSWHTQEELPAVNASVWGAALPPCLKVSSYRFGEQLQIHEAFICIKLHVPTASTLPTAGQR